MKHNWNDPKAELWKRVHIAFDERCDPSQDEAVLDLLLEHPELSPIMDEVLQLESKLEALERIAAPAPQKLAFRFSMHRARAASVAAALILISTPFVFGPKDLTPSLEDSAAQGTSVEHVAVINEQAPTRSRPIARIHSFELTVANKVIRAPESTSTFTASSQPRPAIRTLTSSRTRLAPRSASTFR